MGGSSHLVMLIIVPSEFKKLIFIAYHASGIGGNLGINKRLCVLRLRSLWLDMRKDIIAWIRACTVCIQAKNTTYVSQQLMHSWPLLAPFAIISADIWSPGNIVSPTVSKCILNCIHDMHQFACSVAMSHVNSAELAQSFMEGVLLKFRLCKGIVVNNDTKIKAVFEAMATSLNIRLHRVAKHNHKAIEINRYHVFLNHNQTIIGAARETH